MNHDLLSSRVIGYYVESSPREAIGRINQRVGEARVPIVGILGAYKCMERPVLSEGSDAL